jgi:hypothetical protein
MPKQKSRSNAILFLARSLLPLLILWLAPAVASAHAYLEKAAPAQRAVVFTPPGQVQLWFNERIEPRFCTVTVTDATGNAVDKGDMHGEADNPKQLSVGLKPLTSGVYTVKYRVLSVDGHVVTSEFPFTVRESR